MVASGGDDPFSDESLGDCVSKRIADVPQTDRDIRFTIADIVGVVGPENFDTWEVPRDLAEEFARLRQESRNRRA